MPRGLIIRPGFRVHIAAGVTVLALAGCGGGDPKAAAGSTSPSQSASASASAATPSASPTPTATATPPPTAKDGTDLKSCRDGTCVVKVRSGQRIPLAGRFRTGPITVTVDGTRVTFKFSFGSGGGGVISSDTSSGGGGGSVNGVKLKAFGAKGGSVIVQVSH